MKVALVLVVLLAHAKRARLDASARMTYNFRIASCIALCAEKYCDLDAKQSLSSGFDSHIFLMEVKSSFTMCKLGCVLSTSGDGFPSSFKDGQRFFLRKSDKSFDVAPPSSVSVLCIEPVTGLGVESVAFTGIVVPSSQPRPVLFVFELFEAARGSTDDDSSSVDEILLDVYFSFSETVSVSVESPCVKCAYKLRASTVAVEGKVSARSASTRWYSRDELAFRFSKTMDVFARSQELANDSVSVVLGLSLLDESMPPVCSIVVEWSYDTVLQEKAFSLNRSMSMTISGLRFTTEYAVRVFALFGNRSRLALSNGSLILCTQSCLELSNHTYSACPPLPVSNVTWEPLVNDSALISWDYSSFPPPGMDTEATLVAESIHFAISLRPLVTFDAYDCQFREPAYFLLLSNRRSVVFSNVASECNYEVSVTVLDSRNRTSPPTFVRRTVAPVEKSHNVLTIIFGALAIGIVVVAIAFMLFAFRCMANRNVARMRSDMSESLRRAAMVSALPVNQVYDRSPETFEAHPSGDIGIRRPRTEFRFYESASLEDERTPSRVHVPSLVGLKDVLPSHIVQRSASDAIASPSPSLSTSSGVCGISSGRNIASTPISSGRVWPFPKILSTVASSPCLLSGTSREKSSYGSTPQSRRGIFAGLNSGAMSLGMVRLEELTFLRQLGNGNFGTVKLVRVREQRAAFKSVHGRFSCPSHKRSDMCKEAETSLELCTKGHENIIQLLGLCYESANFREVCGLIYEWCEGGDLKEMLIKMREKAHILDRETKHSGNQAAVAIAGIGFNEWLCKLASLVKKFALQVARALEFLSALRYVHRDIASRNVLLTRPVVADSFLIDDLQTVKIADFGLCTYIGQSEGYVERRRRKLPLSVLPQEVWYFNCYGLEGDVWEYGCFLIELLTLGDEPKVVVLEERYRPRDDIFEYIESVNSGFKVFDSVHRDGLHCLLRCALNLDKAARPTFTAICDFLTS